MRFWDSSALAPLLVPEDATLRVVSLYGADPSAHVWWASRVECVSAVRRREREGLTPAEVSSALARLDALMSAWTEVRASARVRDLALIALGNHPLRAADSLQLAAALVAADGRPDRLPFVCFDARLSAAAAVEGFPVISA